MNFEPNPENTTWDQAISTITVSEARADIIYDIGRPVHSKGILGVLAQAFVQTLHGLLVPQSLFIPLVISSNLIHTCT
jgi:hypothetical protein